MTTLDLDFKFILKNKCVSLGNTIFHINDVFVKISHFEFFTFGENLCASKLSLKAQNSF